MGDKDKKSKEPDKSAGKKSVNPSVDRVGEVGSLEIEFFNFYKRIRSGAVPDTASLCQPDLVRFVLKEVWDDPSQPPPSLDSMAARFWGVDHLLHNRDPELDAPSGFIYPGPTARWLEKARKRTWRGNSTETRDAYQPTLLLDEAIVILKRWKKRGFGHSSLPVGDLAKRAGDEANRTRTEGAAGLQVRKQFNPWADERIQDDVLDLLHYTLSTRHRSFNSEFDVHTTFIVNKAWFALGRWDDRGLIKIELYCGFFIIKSEAAGSAPRLLRTCHIQTPYRRSDPPIRHDGYLFQNHDKHLVIGLRRNRMGSETPQVMVLDGVNAYGQYGGVFSRLKGWQLTYDMFELGASSENGLVGSGIHIRFNKDWTDRAAAQQNATLQSLLLEMEQSDESYCKRLERRPGSPSSSGFHSSVDDHHEELNKEECEVLLALGPFNRWSENDLRRFIPNYDSIRLPVNGTDTENS